MKTTLRSALLASLLLCGSPLFAQTGVPRGISYQATITDETGAVIAPLPGAAIQYNITVRVFDSATGGTQEWAEVFNSTPVSNGRFSVILGQGVPAPGATNPTDLATIFDGEFRFVEISVVPTATPNAPPKDFSPRQQLLASPTALRARIAEIAQVAEVANGLSQGGLTANAIPNGSLTGAIFENGAVDALKIGGGIGAVDNTEFNFLNGVTSGIQGQLNGKAPLANPSFTGFTLTSTGEIRAAQSVVVDSGNTNNGTFSPGIRFGNVTSKEGITSRRTAGDASTNGLSFFTNGINRMTIQNGGDIVVNRSLGVVGDIGVDGVIVAGGGELSGFRLEAFLGEFGAFDVADQFTNNLPHSIVAVNRMRAKGYDVESDARIKEVLQVSDKIRDLETLAKIEIVDYLYKDRVKMGSRRQKKVIAQQVEGIFPQAVGQRKNVVPDIYTKAPVVDGWVILGNDLKKGDRVELVTEKSTELHQVIEALQGKFRTDKEIGGDQVFVYGREVDDFRFVDYDAIAMLNVSATQELHRRLEGKTKEIEEMKKEMAALKGLVSNLQKKDETREARMIAIENLLTNDSKSVKNVSN